MENDAGEHNPEFNLTDLMDREIGDGALEEISRQYRAQLSHYKGELELARYIKYIRIEHSYYGLDEDMSVDYTDEFLGLPSGTAERAEYLLTIIGEWRAIALITNMPTVALCWISAHFYFDQRDMVEAYIEGGLYGLEHVKAVLKKYGYRIGD